MRAWGPSPDGSTLGVGQHGSHGLGPRPLIPHRLGKGAHRHRIPPDGSTLGIGQHGIHRLDLVALLLQRRAGLGRVRSPLGLPDDLHLAGRLPPAPVLLQLHQRARRG